MGAAVEDGKSDEAGVSISSSKVLYAVLAFIKSWGWWFLCIAIGIRAGIAWFDYTLTVAPVFRGHGCCDVLEYASRGQDSISNVLRHVSHRTFGYPLFLSIFWAAYDGAFSYLNGALIFQLGFSFFSSLLLVAALARCGFKVRPILVVLLLAHPALMGMAAMVLTDSLATSFFTCALAAAAFMSVERRWMPICCLVAGVAIGAATAARPSFVAIVVLFFLVIVLVSLSGGGGKAIFRRTCVGITMYSLGLLPFLAVLVSNCHAVFGVACLSNPKFNREMVAASFEIALESSRTSGFLTPNVGWSWGHTPDPFFKDCVISREDPFGSLFTCYWKHALELPVYFFRRLIGIFDYHHLTPYAALVTPVWYAWVARGFSVVSFIGALMMPIVLLGRMKQRRAYAFLILPIAYLAVQIHFHEEARYVLPITPICFCLCLATLLNPGATSIRRFLTLWLASLVAGAIFFYVISTWDAAYLAQHGVL